MQNPYWLLPREAYGSYQTYLEDTGDNAVVKARSLTPELVLNEIRQSGLRGRGGAGFPTGTKWRTLQTRSCPTRFVVCNAAEGEPGTFKDRYLLRKNPYSTIEGMLIAAHVIGAQHLYIGLKTSFALEIQRIKDALNEFWKMGLLEGLRFTIVEGPEEYLFGEEKALLNVIDGAGPLPREAHYPPYELGLFAKPDSPNPALVNNAETFAHVASIVRNGAANFRAIGTADTPGTCLFTLCGDVSRPGVYERPAGITIRQLLYEVAGGPSQGRDFKVVLSGVATGVIMPDKFDTPAEFGSLHMIGSGLGSAGFIAYCEGTSSPRIAQMVARFLYVESCNQCTACKHGLRTASTTLDKYFSLEGAGEDDFDRALAGAQHAPQANRCYLPVQGSMLITSLMTRFRHEFDALQAGSAEARETVPIPKIKDFNEAIGAFEYDEFQEHKNPDWSYSVPRHPVPKPAAPAAASHGPVSIHLAPDVREAFLALARSGSVDLEKQVNDTLRQWLESR